MALFSRRVSDICEASFLVAPLTQEGRQLTLARITVRRLGDDDHPLVNVLVIPVPSSLFRAPVVLSAKRYAHVWEDLHLSFGEKQPPLPEQPVVLSFGARSNRLRLCSSVDELRHVRMDALPLQLPAPLVEEVERRYADGYQFIVVAFRESPVVRLQLAFTHPLMRNALFVPLLCVAPRGIPFGERPSVVVDDAPQWNERTVSVFSCDTSSGCGKSLRLTKDTPFVATKLSIKPTSIRHARRQPRLDEWLPLSSLYLGLLQLESLIECRDLKGAQSLLTALMKKKPSSCLVRAHYARLVGLQGHRDEAKREFETAVALDPSSAIPWAMLGKFHLENARYKKAAESFRRALERHSNNGASMIGLAVCLSATDPTKKEEAKILLKRALQLDPTCSAQVNAPLAALDHPMPLSFPQRLAITNNDQKDREDALSHFDAYFSQLHQESERLFPGAIAFDQLDD